MTDWFRPDGANAFCLSLHVQPGAARNEVAGRHGDALKIRLAAPPVDGKANVALLAALAAWLGVPKRAVAIKSGHASRRKVVRVEGVDAGTLTALTVLGSM
ncbi:MAG: DUF167 domain-containing protein [Zoogloeaceae bacterium]|jgi:uncharacterized protein (TIGR00251 family)|nr:DUF167 domain-containing protein [Zoogloeaceae bacterium]